MLRRALYGIAGTAMSLLAPMVAAQVPPAMDRVPTDALVVGAIKNLESFNKELSGLATAIGVPAEALTQLNEVSDLLKTPGLNAGGSAAFAMMPGAAGAEGADEDEAGDEEGRMLMILPVADYQGFVKGLGGAATAGLDEVEVDGKTLFLKNLDGGFIAASPMREVVDAYQPKGGSTTAFEQMLGASGKAVADRSDIFFVANIPALAPKIKEGMDGFKQQAEMMAMMAGGAQQPNFEAMQAFADEFVRDAKGAVMGMDFAETGLNVGMGAHFAEGSQMAGYFSGKGNAGQILAALPNQPFLMSFAMDTSSPGIKSLLKRLGEINKNQAEAMGGMMNFTKMADKMDGMGFFWGTTPALMGGLFLNTTAFVKTSDPAAYLTEMKSSLEGINNKEINGTTFQTSYQAGGAKIGDREVDVWTMKMQADPTDPAAQQMAQMQMMLFGPTGLGGYAAKLENGVVMTYSKNNSLLDQAVAAAKGGDGLNKDAGIAQVSGQLPDNRSVAGYIGVKNIMEVAIGFAGMMGAAPADFQIPQDLPPIGFGAVTDAGGVQGQIFIPAQVMKTVKSFADTMGGGMGGDEMEENGDDAGQPEF